MTRIYQALAALCIIKPASLDPRADVLVQEHTDILDLLETGNGEELHKAIKDTCRSRPGPPLNKA
jgi:hypothetical protein